MDKLLIGGVEFQSRLITGTGKFSNYNLISSMLESSESEMITVALRRVDLTGRSENILEYIPKNITLLPNTSGARTAEEAIKIARIARASGCGNFIKIEIINDMKYLMPDNEETVKATEILAKEGFIVMPYINPDLITAKKLEKAGAASVMPLGAPIGSNRGLLTKAMIEILVENCSLPIIVDAGIGKPSHACEAMEMGVSAVLVDTAIATSENPVAMGLAFKKAVEAGREAYLAKCPEINKVAIASSPLTGFLRGVEK
ncbi:thiazole synthase [Cetobacterium sp. 2A]|uniref:thiazole synthase n=1 Tax=Cetobacterium sp. 2A TaxID=2754723 RepID=UPI00163CF5B6|nr:thiazole synthase [Cetobacterium sp. 2A]MBC2857148.1 thiazole synthase [Cetobacterium sp. 2A]